MTNVVLVGCGAVTQLYYAPALRELEKTKEMRVRALFDPSPAALKAVGQSFPQATHLEDLEGVGRLGADLAVIASPPRFHASQSISALRAGLSVLCEKPMATTVEEGEAMIDAAKRTGGVLAIGLLRRFFAVSETIRAMLSGNMLGEITSFTGFEGGNFRWPVASPDYFRKSVSAGGVLLDIGSHAFDLMLWWFGEPELISYEDDAMGGTEVNCRVKLRFPQGFEAALRFSRDWPRPNRYLFQCTKGWIRWAVNEAEALQVGFADTPHILDARVPLGKSKNGFFSTAASPNFHRSFLAQIRNVAAAHHGREPVRVSGEEGLRSLKLIERCYRERRLMPMAWLSVSEMEGAHMFSTQSTG